jgi:hypothetical protein
MGDDEERRQHGMGSRGWRSDATTTSGRLAVVIVLPFAASCLSQVSGGTVSESVYGAYDARRFSSSPISTSLAGGKVGWEARKAFSPLAGFVEAGYLGGSEGLDILSVGAGGRLILFTDGRIALGAQGLVEYEHARLDRHRNANSLVAFAVGGYGELRVVSRCSLTLTLSAHAFADGTPPTMCNDGSSSQSTGQGTCSHHGGIDFYTDRLGAGGGLDALVGIRVWFDEGGFGSDDRSR